MTEDTHGRLFAVRLHPEHGPHQIVVLLASSAEEATAAARTSTQLDDVAATVRDCAPDESLIVTIGGPAN